MKKVMGLVASVLVGLALQAGVARATDVFRFGKSLATLRGSDFFQKYKLFQDGRDERQGDRWLIFHPEGRLEKVVVAAVYVVKDGFGASSLLVDRRVVEDPGDRDMAKRMVADFLAGALAPAELASIVDFEASVQPPEEESIASPMAALGAPAAKAGKPRAGKTQADAKKASAEDRAWAGTAGGSKRTLPGGRILRVRNFQMQDRIAVEILVQDPKMEPKPLAAEVVPHPG